MRDNDFDPYHNWEQQTHSRLTGKVRERNISPPRLWMITAVISILLALLFAATTVYLLFNRSATASTINRPNNTAIISTSVPASPISQTQVTLTPTPSLESTTVSTPSGTQTISLNKTLTCTTDCGSVHITITTATISNNTDQFMLTLIIDPGTAQGNYYFGNLDIQDANGTTYQPQGQVRDTLRFDLVPHQPITLMATYPFIPQSGLLYTLKTTLWSETSGAGEQLFGDYQFKL